MANDSAPTMVTGGSQRLDGALKAIEGMRRISCNHHKGFIILIPASFTQCHIGDSFFAWVILSNRAARDDSERLYSATRGWQPSAVA